MSTDIAESLPKRKFAQAAIANAPASKAPKGKKDDVADKEEVTEIIEKKIQSA